jgi:hypothetical protein
MTTASQARRIAERIGRLGEEVRASFQLSDADQRIASLERVCNEMLCEMLPVIGWLERRRPAETAYLVKRRLDDVVRDAVQCAGLDIPEFADITGVQVTGVPSLGAARAAVLLVKAKALRDSLLRWADDIEAEDQQRSPESPPAEPELSDRQRDMLQILFERKAFEVDPRLTTDEVAEAVCGRGRGNPETFKAPMADLARRQLVCTKEGRSGGVWLTPQGKAHIQQARKL